MKQSLFFSLLLLFVAPLYSQNVLLPTIFDNNIQNNELAFHGDLLPKKKCAIQFGDLELNQQLHILGLEIISILPKKSIKVAEFYRTQQDTVMKNQNFVADSIVAGKIYMTDPLTADYEGGYISGGIVIIEYLEVLGEVSVYFKNVTVNIIEKGNWKAEDPDWKQ